MESIHPVGEKSGDSRAVEAFFVPAGARSGPFPGPAEALGMEKIHEPDASRGGWVYNHRYGKPKWKSVFNAVLASRIADSGSGLCCRRDFSEHHF